MKREHGCSASSDARLTNPFNTLSPVEKLNIRFVILFPRQIEERKFNRVEMNEKKRMKSDEGQRATTNLP